MPLIRNPFELKRFRKTAFIFILLSFQILSFGQSPGRVVINEFMPWSGCNPDGEFVELLNYGPGPVNIGCYIVTNGTYAVTIPPNTILQAGEYYVLAGSDILAEDCGNVDSSIHVQLNWNTCNCSDKPVPTTGDGFFEDGGNGNEKVILLDPSLHAVDAVTRDAVPSASIPITTSSVAGQCSSRTFDLDTMTIKYEALGMSTGKANSFARTLDGDCEWVKDPPQSAHATNNRSGDKPSAVNYDFTIVGSTDCDENHGSIDIYVDIVDTTVAEYDRTFPMNYTIAYDNNNDYQFNFDDVYSYGVDSTAPSIEILNLPMGRYRITVSSVYGCFLATFNFAILECIEPLRVQLNYFRLLERGDRYQTFQWLLTDVETIQTMVLEKSRNGVSFIAESSFSPSTLKGTKVFTKNIPVTEFNYYRLRLMGKDGKITYSAIINTATKAAAENLLWPNPANSEVNLKLSAKTAGEGLYKIYGTANLEATGKLSLQKGTNNIKIPVSNLKTGFYQLVVTSPGSNEVSFYRFLVVK